MLVTTDRGYEHQHNLMRLVCGVILLVTKSNKIDDVRQLVAPLLGTLNEWVPLKLVKLVQ